MATQLGRYQLQRPIGRGGMAEVWLASRRGAGGVEKRVVIKRILRERVSDPRFLDLFVQEAEISMSLSHKNIVPIFDFGRVGDELFLVMDYVDGPNLALALSIASRRARLPNAILACHIIFEACQALAYAHDYKNDAGVAQRIAHRDVTPGNLLLSFSGEVKLGDFGLAAATADLRKGDGGTRGTPGYMAPEQARGEMAGPAADIFSLGLILREVLLGKKVRTGEQTEQLRLAKEALPQLPASMPKALSAICRRACSFDAQDRYPSAQAMAADLDVYLVQARAESTSDPRPMPQQISDWLAATFPDGLVTKDYKGTQIEGSARTFLDDGLQDLLEDHGDATMRSMAATALDDPAPSAELAKESTGALARSDKDNPLGAPTRSRRGLALLASGGVLAGAAALFISMQGQEEPAWLGSDARLATDAEVARDAGADAIAADASASDAMLPIDAAPLDARLRQPVHHRPARTDATSHTLATLRISSSPWATVRVLGRNEGCDETPCVIPLPEGRYQLFLENPVAGLKKTVTVEVHGDTSVHQVLEATR